VTAADRGNARSRGVAPARILLIVLACGAFAAASLWLARVDGGVAGAPPSPFAGDAPDPAAILRARPADATAFRLLADAADAGGDARRAQRLYAIAARRNPRDVQVQLHLADAALARHDARAVLRHLDAAMRVAPDAAEPALREVLRDGLDDPATRAALVAQLTSNPPWRERLPGLLAKGDPRAALALLAALAARPLPPPELALQVSLLETLGRPADSRAAWRAALPAKARPLDGLLFDGGFEYGEGPEPYGWRLPSTPEALVGLESTHVAEGHGALSVLLQGRAVLLGDVSQRLVLAPGRYALALQADSALTGSGRGFAWVLACNSTQAELARIVLPRQTRGWQRFEAAFAVGADCPTQTLRLVHEGRNLAERAVSGRLGVDAMRIVPGAG
jgi:hypothetical protein